MAKYNSKNFRKAVNRTKKQFKDEFPSNFKVGNSSLSLLHSYMKLPAVKNSESRRRIREEISTEKLICDLGLTELASLSAAHLEIDAEKKELGNFNIFHFSIVQIANTAMAIQRLLLSGFENQSRILLRSLIENIMVLMVIMLDSQIRREFENAGEKHERVWHKYFAKGKIWNLLEHFMKKNFKDKDLSFYIPMFRDYYKMYCSNIHSSALTSVMLSSEMAFELEDDSMKSGIFGAVHPGLIGSSRQLIMFLIILNIFNAEFFKDIRKIKFPTEHMMFNDYFFRSYIFGKIGASYLAVIDKAEREKESQKK